MKADSNRAKLLRQVPGVPAENDDISHQTLFPPARGEFNTQSDRLYKDSWTLDGLNFRPEDDRARQNCYTLPDVRNRVAVQTPNKRSKGPVQ